MAPDSLSDDPRTPESAEQDPLSRSLSLSRSRSPRTLESRSLSRSRSLSLDTNVPDDSPFRRDTESEATDSWSDRQPERRICKHERHEES